MIETNFRLVDPLPIGDGEVVDSNIIDSLPSDSTSPVDYQTWDATDTYATTDDDVCWIYTAPGATSARFGVFASKINSNKNYEPEKYYGMEYWDEQRRAADYAGGTTYADGDVVYISGGYFYESLQNANTGHTPASSPTWWTLVQTANLWNASVTYDAGNLIIRESGGSGYLFLSKTSGNINHDPVSGSTTLPGAALWTKLRDVPVWATATTYGIGAIVGRVDGATGGIYQSLKAGNVGKDPNSEPTWWQQTTENTYEEWDAATTYALDAVACVFVHDKLAYVYRSLAGTNLNHAPGSSPTWWAFLGEAYAEYASGTTYAAGEIVKIGHELYESAAGTNTGHTPIGDDGTWWIPLGATNRWAMFDDSNSTQSAYGNVIDVTLRMADPLNTIALLEVDADSVRVTVTDTTGTLYDETFDMYDRPGDAGWYTYFFAPLINRRSVLVSPVYVPAGADIRMIASRPGNTAKIGNVLVGHALGLGASLMDAEVGIDDFSRVEEDELSRRVIVERNFRRVANLVVAVDANRSDSVVEALAARRATPTLYIGADEFSSLLIYGFAKSWRGQIKYQNMHYFPIELIGLT